MKNPVSSAGVPKLALTRKEAANALGVSTVTIDRLTERGLLKPSRAIRRPLFPVSEIERFLQATQGPRPNRKPGAGRSPSQ